jgi:hypothetical protein
MSTSAKKIVATNVKRLKAKLGDQFSSVEKAVDRLIAADKSGVFRLDGSTSKSVAPRIASEII